MPETPIDARHGTRTDELEFTVLEIDELSDTARVALVADESEDEFYVIDQREGTSPLEIGERYRVEQALAVDSAFDAERADADEFDRVSEFDCPRCNGELTVEMGGEEPPSPAMDALDQVGASGVHIALVEDSLVTRLSDDDWRPFRRTRGRPRQPRVPMAVCRECGFQHRVDDLERLRERGADGVGESPDHVLYSVETHAAHADAAMANESLGMATGGAMDATNFRQNIEEGYLPNLDALTYEGLFYDYYFETASDRDGARDGLFYPTYSTAVSDHPLTGETERFLTVGLNSTLSIDDFSRRRLNLIAVLDVSGSMDSPFDQYYYDEHGNRQERESDSTATKMEAAAASLAALTEHLDDEDRFGVVLYNNQAHVAKPLSFVGDVDMDAIRSHIRDVRADGGTNMSAGLETAVDLLQSSEDVDPADIENRLVFLTDAMPNTGATGRNTIIGTVESAADRGIYTTFVGVGIDANPDLIESLSKVRGANHYFINSTEEFAQRLDDEFEYMVTPLVFDLQLDLHAEGCEIQAVYGSPNADAGTGQLLHVATLFPSPTEDGETRGGVVLLQLAGDPSVGTVELEASWEEVDGTIGSDRVSIDFDEPSSDSFENTGIRKAVCLARYGRELNRWLNAIAGENEGDWHPMRQTGEWERSSQPLFVPEEMAERFEAFENYLSEEREALGDETLDQELDVLARLCEPWASKPVEHRDGSVD